MNSDQIVKFRKSKEPFGWLGNMTSFPILHEGISWKTAEALFQALRFSDESIREEIRGKTSPMTAKFFAKSHIGQMTVTPQSEQDLNNMKLVIRLKTEQNDDIKAQLLDTGDALIIEDCTNRPHGSGLFWGAAWNGSEWIGKNVLGQLWMELRSSLRSS